MALSREQLGDLGKAELARVVSGAGCKAHLCSASLAHPDCRIARHSFLKGSTRVRNSGLV